MEEFRFAMAYIARYSPRPGATSSRWPDDVSRDERFQGEKWVDFSGTCEGGEQGLAVFDHPDNPGFPGRAHTSAYGPIGLSHQHPGLDGGDERVTFRYGAYVHRGNAKAGQVEKCYRAYCET